MVLRGDVAKDDSGSCCVHQARIFGVSNDGGKSSGRDFQTARMRRTATGAGSACTHVKMEDALNKFKLPELECPIVWIRLHRWKRQFEEVSKEDGWEKVSGWECLFWNRQEGRFLSEYMDDIEIAGKKAILKPIWIDDDETNRSGGTNCSIVPAVIQDPKSFL